MKTSKASLTNAKALPSRRSLVLALAGYPTSMQTVCIRPDHIGFGVHWTNEGREDQVSPGEGAGR